MELHLCAIVVILTHVLPHLPSHTLLHVWFRPAFRVTTMPCDISQYTILALTQQRASRATIMALPALSSSSKQLAAHTHAGVTLGHFSAPSRGCTVFVTSWPTGSNNGLLHCQSILQLTGYAESCIEFANQNWIIIYPSDSSSRPNLAGEGGLEKGDWRDKGGCGGDPCCLVSYISLEPDLGLAVNRLKDEAVWLQWMVSAYMPWSGHCTDL